MKCLQCNKPATDSGEVYGTRAIRVCADGHRTVEASAAEIKWSEASKCIGGSKKQKKTANQKTVFGGNDSASLAVGE